MSEIRQGYKSDILVFIDTFHFENCTKRKTAIKELG
jgi:hypothetical protein